MPSLYIYLYIHIIYPVPARKQAPPVNGTLMKEFGSCAY